MPIVKSNKNNVFMKTRTDVYSMMYKEHQYVIVIINTNNVKIYEAQYYHHEQPICEVNKITELWNAFLQLQKEKEN